MKHKRLEMTSDGCDSESRFVRLFVWLFGWRPKGWCATDSAFPELVWEMTPVGDFDSFLIRIPVAPNVLHRFLQRVLLGVKYRRNTSDSRTPQYKVGP